VILGSSVSAAAADDDDDDDDDARVARPLRHVISGSGSPSAEQSKVTV